VDAKHQLSIRIIPADAKVEGQKDPATCAVAEACKRAFNADAAIIGTRSAYMVLGSQAIRYRIPTTVSRQIKAFDRGQGFNPGIYNLQVPTQGERLGQGRDGNRTGLGKPKGKHSFHHTRDVRALLGTAAKEAIKEDKLAADSAVREAMSAYKKALRSMAK